MRWLMVAVLVACSSRQPPAEPVGSGSAEKPAAAVATVDDNGVPIIRVDSKTTHTLVEHAGTAPDKPTDGTTGIELSVAGARHALFDTAVTGKANTGCKVQVRANADRKLEYGGDHGCVRSVSFSPDGSQVAIDGPDKLWITDIASGKTRELQVPAEDVRWIGAGLIVMRPARPGQRGRELALVDPATGAARTIATTHGRLVEAAADQVVVTRVLIENAVPPCPPADCFPAPKLGYDVLDIRDGKTTSLAFPELSGIVVLASDGAVAIKSLYVLYVFAADGKALPPRHIGFVGSGDIAALSKGGRYYALADDKKIRIYDVVAGTLVADAWANARVTALAFDGDTRLVAYTDRLVTYDLVPAP